MVLLPIVHPKWVTTKVAVALETVQEHSSSRPPPKFGDYPLHYQST